MRVLHLISSVYFFGAERVVAELAASLPAFDVAVHVGVLSVDDQLVYIFRQVIDDADVTVVGFDGQGMFNVGTIKEIGRYLVENKIDIVHCHGYKSNIYAFVARMFSCSKACLVSTNHNWIGTTTRENIYQKIDALILRFFDKIIAVSPDVKQQMIDTGIKARKIFIIDNGINIKDSAFFTPVADARALLGIDPEYFVIGNIARLTPEKAQTDLLHAFVKLDELSNLKLVLVGDGPEYSTLQRLIESLGLQKKVIMAGNRDDARKLYTAFNVFALVSTNEGLPMVLLEAMAAGVPVIATRVGAIPDVIHDGQNGLLINPSEQGELLEAIRTLCTNGEMRKQLADAAKQMVGQSFSSRFMAGEYCKQYKSVVREGLDE